MLKQEKKQEMGKGLEFKAPEKKVEAGRGYKMKIEYGNEQAKTRTWLKNGKELKIRPLLMSSFIDSKSSEIKEAEEEVAEGIDMSDSEGVQEIKEQLSDSQLHGVYVKYLVETFRQYGDQVGMVSKESGNIDYLKKTLGNIADFDDPNAMVLAISENGGERMESLLQNPPSNLFDTRIKFRKPYRDYISDDNGNKIGFTMMITYGNENQPEGSTLEKKLYFLFVQDENSEVEEQAESVVGQEQTNITELHKKTEESVSDEEEQELRLAA